MVDKRNRPAAERVSKAKARSEKLSSFRHLQRIGEVNTSELTKRQERLRVIKEGRGSFGGGGGNGWSAEAIEAVCEDLWEYVRDEEVLNFIDWYYETGVTRGAINNLVNSYPAVAETWRDCKGILAERYIERSINDKVAPWTLQTMVPMYSKEIRSHQKEVLSEDCEIREGAKARHGTSELDMMGRLGGVIAAAADSLQRSGIRRVAVDIPVVVDSSSSVYSPDAVVQAVTPDIEDEGISDE